MNVLSLFDGIACGRMALERAGIDFDVYYASEIDPYALKVVETRFPDAVQVGDVRQLHAGDLDRIDLLIGGSPCTGFSVAGRRLNFEDPQSKLFFEYVRLLKECSPKWFLLENVSMRREWVDVISSSLGVEPVTIDSNLVSAQNRKRMYWTNIPVKGLPEDEGLLLDEIIEKGVVVREKSQTILSTLYKENAKSMLKRKKWGLLVGDRCSDKRYTLSDELIDRYDLGRWRDSQWPGTSFTDRRTEEAKRVRRECRKKGVDFCPRRMQEIVPREDGKTGCLTKALTKEHILVDKEYQLRKLTPLECERLQTIPDGYTDMLSDTRRYQVLGNAWTVNVVAHILKGLLK